MTLTLGQLRSHVQLAVGGDPSTAPGMTVPERTAQLINNAGEHLMSRSWRWRERTSTVVASTASQDYLSLPSDCGEILTIEPKNSWSASLQFVDPATFEKISTEGIEPELSYVVTLVFHDSSGVATPRLDIYPTPSSTDATAFNIRYRAQWVALNNASNVNGTDDAVLLGTSHALIPQYMESLLFEYIRAFSEGGEDGTTQQRLALVDGGILLDQALRKDGTFQPDYGSLPAAGFRGLGQSYAAGTVSAPSASAVVWMGTWASSTTYAVNDLVHWGVAQGGDGSSQICILAAQGSSQSPDYDAYWDLFST